MRGHSRLAWSILIVVAAICAVIVGRGALSRWHAHRQPPNVVIIVMDTARQDRLSCYGYERDTSPRLRELAKTSTVFGNAYSTSSWTSPAHASLFTGLYPIAHGVTQEHWRMSDGLVTLAEVLTQQGYETVGIVENPILSDRNGFDQGFSVYYSTWRIDSALDKLPSRGPTETGNTAADLFLQTVRRSRKSPFFIFVNLIEPHSPYDSSEQFENEFVTDRDISLVENMWREHYLGRRVLTEAEIRHLSELYDAELLYTDYLVGIMMDGLKASGCWDNTLFIVTSDHGENIGDHGHMDHVFSLYETLIRVPLIVRYPGGFGSASADGRPVQLTDIFPTVLEAAGVDRRAFPSEGLSLLSDRVPSDRAIFTEYYWPAQVLSCFDEADRSDPALQPYKRRLRSVISGGTKLIWASDGRNEMYDLADDPDELVNVWGGQGDSTATRGIESKLAEAVSRFGADREVTPEDVPTDGVDEATREALRSLGYLR